MDISLNESQALFVIKSEGGYSCLGFEVCFNRTEQLATRMGLTLPEASAIGTLDQYAQYREYAALFASHPSNEQTWYEAGTPDRVQQLLESYRGTKKRLRLFFGNAETGEDWMEENDVVGYVSRSMGPMRVPLLVQAGKMGGGAISTSSIVRIMDMSSYRVMYEHDDYAMPDFRIKQSATGPAAYPYVTETRRESGWSVHSRHKSMQSAENYVEFLKGNLATPNPRKKAA